MRPTASPSRRAPSSRFAELHLPAAEFQRLRGVLRDLLAQRQGPLTDHWYESLLRSIATVTASDKALLVVRRPEGGYQYAVGLSREVLARYANRFAELDRSRVAFSQYGLEVWSLEQLWQAGELERSEYHRGFAVPNGLRSTIGVTLQLSNPRAELCLILHKGWPDVAGETVRRREILELLLEPIRVGFGIDLGARDQSSGLSSLMDVTGQALALYGMDGHELAQNPVMRRVLNQDPDREALRGYLRDVAQSVVATLGRRERGKAVGHHQDGTRREVATSHAAYRLRGNLVGRNTVGHGTAVLVSLDRVAFQIPAPDSIRSRYGLTVRELQVASLLMHRLTNVEIARMLGISPHTARHHTENVLAKVGVRSREALRRAIQEPPPAIS